MFRSMYIGGAVVVLAVALGACGGSAQGQANPPGQAAAKPALPPLPEMWTKLEAKLDSGALKPGDAVRAEVSSDGWVYGACGIQGGSTLQGTVIENVAGRGPKAASAVSLSFTGDCGNGVKKALILIAVYFPVEDSKSQMDIYNAMPQGIGAGASGRQSTNLDSLPSPGAGTPSQQLPLAKFGEVKGIKHLSLAVAKGAKGSTVLSSTDKRLRLEAGTRLVLVPVPEAH